MTPIMNQMSKEELILRNQFCHHCDKIKSLLEIPGLDFSSTELEFHITQKQKIEKRFDSMISEILMSFKND